MASDAYTLQPAIPEGTMVPLITHYTIAFWKKFLEGDDGYMRYLTPGYAKRNGFEAVVESSDVAPATARKARCRVTARRRRCVSWRRRAQSTSRRLSLP